MATRVRTYKSARHLKNGDFVALQLPPQTLPHWWIIRDVVVGREVTSFTAVRDGMEREVQALNLEQMTVKELA